MANVGPQTQLHANSAPIDFARVIEANTVCIQELQNEVVALRVKVDLLEVKGNGGGGHSSGGGGGGCFNRNLTELKAMQGMPHYSGDEKTFQSFEAKLFNLLLNHFGFESFLNWVNHLDEEPEVGVVIQYAD